jgi:hypothetical protein
VKVIGIMEDRIRLSMKGIDQKTGNFKNVLLAKNRNEEEGDRQPNK